MMRPFGSRSYMNRRVLRMDVSIFTVRKRRKIVKFGKKNHCNKKLNQRISSENKNGGGSRSAQIQHASTSANLLRSLHTKNTCNIFDIPMDDLRREIN